MAHHHARAARVGDLGDHEEAAGRQALEGEGAAGVAAGGPHEAAHIGVVVGDHPTAHALDRFAGRFNRAVQGANPFARIGRVRRQADRISGAATAGRGGSMNPA